MIDFFGSHVIGLRRASLERVKEAKSNGYPELEHILQLLLHLDIATESCKA